MYLCPVAEPKIPPRVTRAVALAAAQPRPGLCNARLRRGQANRELSTRPTGGTSLISSKRRISDRRVAGLLGLAFDHLDGHKRITTGEKFILVGGSEGTHERMTETIVKTFEELKRRDKQLETVDPRELGEIIDRSQPR